MDSDRRLEECPVLTFGPFFYKITPNISLSVENLRAVSDLQRVVYGARPWCGQLFPIFVRHGTDASDIGT